MLPADHRHAFRRVDSWMQGRDVVAEEECVGSEITGPGCGRLRRRVEGRTEAESWGRGKRVAIRERIAA